MAGIPLGSLTTAERQFLGTYISPEGKLFPCEYTFMLVERYESSTGKLPLNAVEIAFSTSDPDTFIATNPRLINPATNKLYESYQAVTFAPLGICIIPKDEEFGTKKWHVKVWREKRKELLIDLSMSFPHR
jgi:hypothetical protein